MKYFLLFLVVHSTVFLYFGYLLTLVLLSPVFEHRMWEMSFTDRGSGERWTGIGLTLNFLISNSPILIVLTFMAILFGLCLFGFLAYHIYLISTGQTTNESFKWASCYRLHKQLTECHQNYLDAVAQGVEFVMQDEEHDDAKLPAEDLGESVDSTVATADKSDNKECRAVDRNKNNESMPDRRHFLRQMVEQDEIPYYLVVDPGERPKNTYNKGFLKNLYRVLFPPSEPLLRNLAREEREKAKNMASLVEEEDSFNNVEVKGDLQKRNINGGLKKSSKRSKRTRCEK